MKPKGAYVDSEQPETKESYKEIRETEQEKWSRPEHKIEANERKKAEAKEVRKVTRVGSLD